MTSLTVLLMTLTWWTSVMGRDASLWEITNEVEPFTQKRGLATCRRGAVCGLVQANAWGVHSESLCDCAGRSRCSLLWDAEDGHSVTQGSDQYKFCQKVRALDVCQLGELAMTVELVTSRSDPTKYAHYEFLRCRCPAGFLLQQTDSQWRPTQHEDIIITQRSCVQMPVCLPNQQCKFVTFSPTSTLVRVNCACPAHQTCPSHTDRGVQVQSLGRGSQHSIFCR